MNVLSLCSGVGGMDLGLARAGWEHVGFRESDGYRRDVLRARFPGVPVHDDLRLLRPESDVDAGRVDHGELGGARRGERDHVAVRDEVAGGRVDLVAGGTPCHDLSVAGRRAGLAGDRSSLFFDFARVVDAVRPGWVLWENVPGAFSSNGGRDFGTVLGTLADLGYGLAWRVLDSRYFGVPQRRRRVFVVGALADGDPRAAAERAGEVLAVGSRCPRHPATRGEARTDVTGPFMAGPPSGSYRIGAEESRNLVAILSGLGSDGPDDNDGQGGRLIAAPPVRYALNAKHGSRDDGESETFIVADHPRPGSNSNGNIVATAFHVTQNPISGDVSPAMSKGNRRGTSTIGVLIGATVRRLTPTECERLQGFPDGWTDLGDTPDSKRYAALGDAVTVPVAEWIGRRMLAG